MVYIGPLDSDTFKLFKHQAEDFMHEDQIDFVHSENPEEAMRALDVS